MHPTHLLRPLALVAIGALAACGKDNPASPPGTLAVAASRSSLSIIQGRSDTLTLTITRGGSFKGVVTLAASGAPTGATVTLGSPTLAAGETSTTATVTLVASVTPGTYPITVTASGTGVTNQTATLNLAVVAAEVADFRVVASRDTLKMVQGDSTNAYLRLTKTGGFAAAVSLSSGVLPAGVSVTFADTSLTGDSTRVTVRALASTTAGTYPITLTGTSGTTSRADTVSLVIAVAPDFGITVVPDTLTLVAGTNGQVRVRLSRRGGLADTVRLTLTGAPAGVTGTFGDSALTGDSTVLTIATTNATVAGTYGIGVRGTAGTRVRVDTLSLKVTPPPAGNSVDLTTAPAADTIAIKAGDSITVKVKRTGFTGPVRVTTDSLPTGIKIQLDTAGIAGDSARVPISVDSTAMAGSYTIRFIATAAGVAPDTATYALTVVAAGGGIGGSQRAAAALTGRREASARGRASPTDRNRSPSLLPPADRPRLNR